MQLSTLFSTLHAVLISALTVDHVSKLERGTKRPTGPALVLLNVIQRKGMEAIL